MSTNQYLPFCGTDTGTNLPTQGDYLVDPNRDIGAQPGIASSQLNNKPMRQSTAVASQLAQYVAEKLNADVVDDGNMSKLFAQISASIYPIQPKFSKYASGSGSHNVQYVFFITSGSATAAATYTNNSITYTVTTTVASGKMIYVTGNGDPSGLAGTLTKASGTGDTTLTFYAYRKPNLLHIIGSGGGGGGGGSATTAASDGGTGGTGGNTTFGTTLLEANGGGGGPFGTTTPPAGGTSSLGTGPVGLNIVGGSGQGPTVFGPATTGLAGGSGGSNSLGGAGGGGSRGAGGGGATNTGGGGGGGGSPGSGASGAGGGAGGYFDALIYSPLSTYAYVIGAAGTAGAAGTGGNAGGAGGSGVIVVIEYFQ